MRLKQIHEEYCEKQRIAEEEAVRLENHRKQKELEDSMRLEKEIIERIKSLFIEEFEEEIKAIEEAGIKIRYSADCNNRNHLFVNLSYNEKYNTITFSHKKGYFGLNGWNVIWTKEHLMSLIYQYFFC